MIKTVVGIVSRMRPNGNVEYLLVSSKKDFGEFTGFFYPPGGHVEKNEDEKQALIREMLEELNIVVVPVKLIATTMADVKDEEVCWYECQWKSGEIKVDSSEIALAGFYTKEEFKKLKIWPATKNFFEKYIFI